MKTREYPIITCELRGEHAGISPFLTSGESLKNDFKEDKNLESDPKIVLAPNLLP